MLIRRAVHATPLPRARAAGCACYGETVYNEASCNGAQAEAHRRAYRCDAMDDVVVLPDEMLASMTTYDLDTDAAGEYLEQLTVPAYEYFATPLRPESVSYTHLTLPTTPYV